MKRCFGLVLLGLFFLPLLASAKSPQKNHFDIGWSMGIPVGYGFRVASYNNLVGIQADFSYWDARYFNSLGLRINLINCGNSKSFDNTRHIYGFMGLANITETRKARTAVGFNVGVGINARNLGLELGVNIPILDKVEDSMWRTKAIVQWFYLVNFYKILAAQE